MSFLGERNAIAIGVSQHAVLGSGPLLTRLSPSLLLQFAGAESLDPRITFTRASTATYFNSSGLLTTTGFNLLTYSEEFDNAAWTKTNSTITANTIVSPAGTMDADKHIPNNGATIGVGASETRVYQSPSVTSGTSYTYSMYAKAGEYDQLALAFITTPSVSALFSLTLGTIVSGTGATITSVGNGWYRCSLTTAATSTGALQIRWSAESSTVSTGDGTSGIYIWGAQFEAGSIATTYIPTTSSTSGAARFDYNPTTLAPLGLLIEESRTNLILQSEDCSASPWTTASPYSVTTNTAISPDGTQDADSVILASGQTSFSANITRQTVTKAASAIQYTRSVYIKRLGTTTSVRLVDFGSVTANNASVIVSLIDGSILSAATVAGTFTGASASVTSVGNDWYRIALTYTTDTATSLTVRSFPYVGTTQLTGDGSSGLLVWGAQLEAGAFATSYIPTVASQVTRAADVATMTGTNFSSWYNATEGTVYFESETAQGTSSYAYSLFGTSTSNRIFANYNSNLRMNSGVRVNGTFEASVNTPNSTAPLNTFGKGATAYKVNDFGFSWNGATALTDTSTTLPIVLQLDIGNNGGLATNFLNGHIRQIAYYNRRLSDAELQGITA